MAKQKRIAAALIAAAMLLVLLGAALFLIEEAGHDCIGEGCPVCLQMGICRDTLRALLRRCALWFLLPRSGVRCMTTFQPGLMLFPLLRL